MIMQIAIAVTLAALVAGCAAPQGTGQSTVARQNLNSSNLDCDALTPAERALVTPRTGCVEVFRPDEN